MDWTAIAAAISAGAVIVTLALFIAEGRRRAEEARKAATHDAISRVLQTMESAVRWQQRPVFVRMFANPELDYALVVLRLRHELANEKSAIAIWAMSQNQLMIAASSDHESRDIGVKVAGKLVEWGHGQVPDNWFQEQLDLHPPQTTFRVSPAKRMRRALSRSKESLVIGAAIGVAVVIVQELSAAAKRRPGLF